MRYLIALLLVECHLSALAIPELKVGILKGGTVNWELSVITQRELDREAGFSLRTVEFASPGATVVALQSGAVDVIVSDWLWVLDQRKLGRQFDYFPYSSAVGGMLVRRGLPDSLCEIKNRKIGIAGGPRDKNWAVIQHYCLSTASVDLSVQNTLQYGAPPLLSALLERGQLDAVVNYWHFNARLQAKGYSLRADTQSLLAELGVSAQVPVLGWVFSHAWATQQASVLNAFLNASGKAKQILLETENEWDRLRADMQAQDEQIFIALKNAWREGVLTTTKDAQQDAILKTYRMLYTNLVDEKYSSANQNNSNNSHADDLTIHSSLFWAHN